MIIFKGMKTSSINYNNQKTQIMSAIINVNFSIPIFFFSEFKNCFQAMQFEFDQIRKFFFLQVYCQLQIKDQLIAHPYYQKTIKNQVIIILFQQNKYYLLLMTEKINKIIHLPKLSELQNIPNSKFITTLRLKQLKKELQAAKSLNTKRKSEEKPTMNSEQKVIQTPKIRKSHKMLRPMVLDPYKSKTKNDNVLNQKNVKMINLSDNKKEKNNSSAIKTTSSIQRQSSKQSNRTTTKAKNIKGIKQFLKNYVSKHNQKNNQVENVESIQPHNENIPNEQQKLSRANKKRQILDKVNMKGKYRCRVNQVVFQQKPQPEKISESYWNNVLQSDISFKQQNQISEQFLYKSFLNNN